MMIVNLIIAHQKIAQHDIAIARQLAYACRARYCFTNSLCPSVCLSNNTLLCQQMDVS